VRGTISRKLIRQVVAATYHQVWWPAHDHEIYPRHATPAWDHAADGYTDPDTGRLLPTWDHALLRSLPELAAPRHPARERARRHAPGLLSRQGPPGRHPRLRRPPLPRLQALDGKTLDEHRAERREHVMRVLGAVGIQAHQDTAEADPDRYRWEPIPPTAREQPNRTKLLIRAVNQRRRWRAEYQCACSATSDLDREQRGGGAGEQVA
jgi:hypothetical protein